MIRFYVVRKISYKECYEVLGAMVRSRRKKACKGGDGPPFYKMRKCCQKKGIEGCWECEKDQKIEN